MPKPNTKFNLSVNDIALIEHSLMYRQRRLIERRGTVKKESSKEKIDIELAQIREIQAKLFHQKEWYRPKGFYVGG